MKILNKIIQCGVHMCKNRSVQYMLPNNRGIIDLTWTEENILLKIKRK